jgi:hypothetical protein
LVQEEVLNVLLDNELGIMPVGKDLLANGLKTCVNGNALTSVRILGWFEDPDRLVRGMFWKG